VQLDEPSLALDRTDAERAAYQRAYKYLASRAGKLQLLVATYFAGLADNLKTAVALPVQGCMSISSARPDSSIRSSPRGPKVECCRWV